MKAITILLVIGVVFSVWYIVILIKWIRDRHSFIVKAFSNRQQKIYSMSIGQFSRFLNQVSMPENGDGRLLFDYKGREVLIESRTNILFGNVYQIYFIDSIILYKTPFAGIVVSLKIKRQLSKFHKNK